MTWIYLSSMKKCFKCGAEKPLSEFYKYPKMPDGTLNKCKECTRKDVAENRNKKRDYYLEYDRNRPNARERAERTMERNRERFKNDPEFKASRLDVIRKYRQQNPNKHSAHSAVNNSLRDGKIVKPNYCEHCGTSEKKIQAHHWSYEPEHWLDVIWLCTSCHGKEHRRLNELGRDPDNF